MNKPIYFNISIDVDTYATDYLTSSCNIEKMVISSYATGLDKLLTYLEKKNIKVTLFVIADHVKFNFVQDYLKNVIANGHEIASHSLSHRRNFSKLNLDELDDEIRKSKETIEDVLGIQVKGFRAPGYTITLKIWELLIKNGFTYDASLNNSLFYYAFKVLYKFFSTKGDFFVVQKLKEFPLDSSPFQVNKSYFNNSYSNVFWEIPFNYSKLISFPFLIFMLNQLPNYISKNSLTRGICFAIILTLNRKERCYGHI